MNTPDETNAAANLAYVSDAMRKRSFDRAAYQISLIWAIVNLVGLSLYDVHVYAGGIFWLIALPAFGIGSGWWFEKQQRDQGEIDRAMGRKHAWHWTAIPIFLLLSNAMFLTNGFSAVMAGQVVLLVVGLVYYLGGVHFWRGYRWGGVALASGMIWLAVLPHFAWTLTGVLTFVALAGTATIDRRRYAI